MFSERERTIYRSPDGRDFDPLRVERQLRIASGGRLNEWLDEIANFDALLGAANVPIADLLQANVAAAQAEDQVVAAARAALAYDKSILDAEVLSTLDHFLRWLEGKDSPAASGPTSPPATEASAPGWIVCQRETGIQEAWNGAAEATRRSSASPSTSPG